MTMIMEGLRVTGLEIPSHLLNGRDTSGLRISLAGSDVPVLGRFTPSDIGLDFRPIVPLTFGQTYELKTNAGVLGEIAIPGAEGPSPELVSIYPQQDTVPENLLKVYLRFSQPMMEGRSASFVYLLKDGRDTMNGTFLDLQPELWNPDGTVLTLWLDPGRIKLDLIPNKELGNPLGKGTRYELVVGQGWRSKEGISMGGSHRKPFFVGDRDDTSPDINKWKLILPTAGTQNPLSIGFMESLDRMLAEETIRVLDGSRQPLEGKYSVGAEDASLEFVPNNPWAKGNYFISVEGRLEDLAGNNLNRLFETDLSKPGARQESRAVYERPFRIQ